MRIGIIGVGAIGRYVHRELTRRGRTVGALLVREPRLSALSEEFKPLVCVARAEDLPNDIDHVVDCGGHAALSAHGPAILRRGLDLTTLSIGALANASLHEQLNNAAAEGKSRLILASGAIGALDALRAAGIGTLHTVTYTGRKPPAGWRGSVAEDKLDLDALTGDAQAHFDGSAREAALNYPKNANVAAAVALAGVGFDATRVRLIADPGVTQNIHEITASGDFGSLSFQISGNALPTNPKSSALAAMSAVSRVEQDIRRMRF